MSDLLKLESRVPMLTTADHARDVVGMKYVYPVVSRRSKGVSIGINLNYNNACNWRCVYCQVPGLTRGAAPEVDLAELRAELEAFVDAAEHGDFLERHVPEQSRRLSDIALSGNGEPTSSPQFTEVIDLLAAFKAERPSLRDLPIVLITNGSLADRAPIRAAIARLASIGGVVWFKVDAGSDAGLHDTNSANTKLDRHLRRLEVVARLCPTYVQSCWFRRGGHEPKPTEVDGYVEALGSLVDSGIPLRGVQLYTLARESHQPESHELQPVDAEWLERLAARVEGVGLAVDVAR